MPTTPRERHSSLSLRYRQPCGDPPIERRCPGPVPLCACLGQVPASCLGAADLLGATPATLPPLHVPLAPCSVSSYLVASICLYPSRTAGVSRYLPPEGWMTCSTSTSSINTHCNVSSYVRQTPKRTVTTGQPTRAGFRIVHVVVGPIGPDLFTAVSRPPPRPLPLALQRSTPHAGKGRVKATRRDATFVAAKPDQGPKPLTSL